MKPMRKRFIFLSLTVLALLATSWFELFVQKKQQLIGGGISRVFFFLLINIHVVLLVVLLYLIIRQSIKLFLERRKEQPGSVFRRNLLFAFTIFSVIPTFFVFFIAGKLIPTCIDNWFEIHVGNGLANGLALHKEQTAETRKKLQLIGNTIAHSCEKMLSTVEHSSTDFAPLFKECTQPFASNDHQAYLWLPEGKPLVGSISDEIRVWRSYRKINDRSMASLKKQFLHTMQSMQGNTHTCDFYGSTYHIRRFHSFIPALNRNTVWYLVVAARYPPAIRYPLIELQSSIADYQHLKSLHNPIIWHYFVIFVLATLLILLLSIWCAFYLAGGISRPVQTLLGAIEKIRKGNYYVQIRLNPSSDLNSIAVGFNEMTKTLRQARSHLEQNYKEMLAILEHLKTSVFIVNHFGRIITYNASAKKLVQTTLGIDRFKNKKATVFGGELTKIFMHLVRELRQKNLVQLSKEISYTHKEQTKTIMVHLTVMQTGVKTSKKTLLVVIEDLTDVVKISKIKTWQQAARQMAHEIKNPLTPIQLATQRLRRRYRKIAGEDKVFNESTNTILSQVNIIRNLVSHFSEFGKMPEQNLEPADINHLIRQVVCLYEVSYPSIRFTYDMQDFLPHLHIDKKKLKRVLINLLDNSVRALNETSRHEKNLRIFSEKEITIKTRFKTGRNQVELIVADTGPGIPYDVRNTLFLPHVSTSKKNMGLGLAIVHENISQMGGSIKLMQTQHGASFQIHLPV